MYCGLQAHAIISRHLEHRNLERLEDPKRFNIKPTVGELAVRTAPLQSPDLNDVEQKLHDITLDEQSGMFYIYVKSTDVESSTY